MHIAHMVSPKVNVQAKFDKPLTVINTKTVHTCPEDGEDLEFRDILLHSLKKYKH